MFFDITPLTVVAGSTLALNQRERDIHYSGASGNIIVPDLGPTWYCIVQCFSTAGVATFVGASGVTIKRGDGSASAATQIGEGAATVLQGTGNGKVYVNGGMIA